MFLKKIQCLKNYGKFKDCGWRSDLRDINLIYATNAVGKSTLSAMFHSLATNVPKLVLARKNLSSTLPPSLELVAETAQGTGIFSFHIDAWRLRDIPITEEVMDIQVLMKISYIQTCMLGRSLELNRVKICTA